MGNGEPGQIGYWIDGPAGCPIGGPFDLWRQNYFFANGEPPEDTAQLYPSLSKQTVTDVAAATVTNGASLDEVLATFGDKGFTVELTLAHRYFSEWLRSAPFLPDSMQDLPRRPARTSPEPLEEILVDLRRESKESRSSKDLPRGREGDTTLPRMPEKSQDKLYATTLRTIGGVAQLPVVHVDREEFLRKHFGDSPHLEVILENGPQAVYSVESLRKQADSIIKSSVTKTSALSFAAGLPGNPAVMVAAGGADVAQYYGFAINLAQQVAYLFGEDELFAGGGGEMSEAAQVRIIAYLGAMFGAAGAAALIAQTSKAAGANIGKKVAAQALTKTTWYPLVKKVGALVGKQVTKKTVEKTITKAVPILGGVVSGGLTYVTFRPMGHRLADTLVKNLNGEFDSILELNPQFAATLEAEIVVGE